MTGGYMRCMLCSKSALLCSKAALLCNMAALLRSGDCACVKIGLPCVGTGGRWRVAAVAQDRKGCGCCSKEAREAIANPMLVVRALLLHMKRTSHVK